MPPAQSKTSSKTPSSALSRHRIWDLPTRTFHWALLLCLVGAVVSVKTGRMQAHLVFGSSLLALVLFRILWGFAGSQTSRFRSFLPRPKAVLACLKAFFQKNSPHIGHDALGGLATLTLLAILLVTSVVGMFANDEILFEGPLAPLVSQTLSDNLTFIHKQLVKVVIALVSLHIAVVLFNLLYKKDDLVSPMVFGKKDLPPPLARQAKTLRFAPTARSVFCLLVSAAVVASVVLL